MSNDAETQRKANKLMGMLNPEDPMEKAYSVIREVGFGFNKVRQAKAENDKLRREASKPKKWTVVEPKGKAVPMPTAMKKDNVKT